MMQPDGDFCIHGGAYCAYTQGTWGASTYMEIQNNGTLGIYTGSGSLIKGSNAAGFEGLIPINIMGGPYSEMFTGEPLT